MSNFTFSSPLQKWSQPFQTWFQQNRAHLLQQFSPSSAAEIRRYGPPIQISGLATSTAIFHPTSATPKILLLQRAATDSMPLRWELPGGAVDDDDETILHAAAREVREEAGLVVTRFEGVLIPLMEGTKREDGGDEVWQMVHLFPSRNVSRWYAKVGFWAEAVSDPEAGTERDGDGVRVKLDPNEHADFAWVTEEEVRAERVGEKDVPITRPAMKGLILDAFRTRKEKKGGEAS